MPKVKEGNSPRHLPVRYSSAGLLFLYDVREIPFTLFMPAFPPPLNRISIAVSQTSFPPPAFQYLETFVISPPCFHPSANSLSLDHSGSTTPGVNNGVYSSLPCTTPRGKNQLSLSRRFVHRHHCAFQSLLFPPPGIHPSANSPFLDLSGSTTSGANCSVDLSGRIDSAFSETSLTLRWNGPTWELKGRKGARSGECVMLPWVYILNL